MDNLIIKDGEERIIRGFDFTWTKDFSYLTISRVLSKISVDSDSLNGEIKKYFLGIIPTKTRDINIPLKNIMKLEMKKKTNIWDVLFGILFVFVGVANPLFLIVAAIFFWSARTTGVVITTKFQNTVEIPTNSNEDAENFMDFVNSL